MPIPALLRVFVFVCFLNSFSNGWVGCDKEVEEVQLSLGAVAALLPIPVLLRVFVFVCLCVCVCVCMFVYMCLCVFQMGVWV